MLEIAPDTRLWFLDGKDDSGKIVFNPNIGYGAGHPAARTARAWSSIASAFERQHDGNIDLRHVNDWKYLAQTFGPTLGKASVTGYCIKFKSLADLDSAVLEDLLRSSAVRPHCSKPDRYPT